MSELDVTKVKSIQTIVGATPDGVWRGKSQAALDALVVRADAPQIVPSPETLPDDQDPVDARSEANIETLHPKVRPLARALLNRAAAQGIKLVITSGSRTYDEQNALFEQGRTKPGKIVTNARGGQSNHNFGIAFDVTVFNGASPKWEGPEYTTAGRLGQALGLTWGGDWTSIKDEPHLELRPDWSGDMSESSMLAELRNRHAKGQDAFA